MESQPRRKLWKFGSWKCVSFDLPPPNLNTVPSSAKTCSINSNRVHLDTASTQAHPKPPRPALQAPLPRLVPRQQQQRHHHQSQPPLQSKQEWLAGVRNSTKPSAATIARSSLRIMAFQHRTSLPGIRLWDRIVILYGLMSGIVFPDHKEGYYCRSRGIL